MAQRDDILLDTITTDAPPPLRVRIAAFVPLTIAVLGVAAVLLGGVSARQERTAAAPSVDTMATGSIPAR